LPSTPASTATGQRMASDVESTIEGIGVKNQVNERVQSTIRRKTNQVDERDFVHFFLATQLNVSILLDRKQLVVCVYALKMSNDLKKFRYNLFVSPMIVPAPPPWTPHVPAASIVVDDSAKRASSIEHAGAGGTS
jgi:hypothetical protein